jgi:predicted permease
MTNPLIVASVAGLIFLFIDISIIPLAVQGALEQVGGIATPLSIILLGGSFMFTEVKKNVKPIVIAVLVRLIVIPAIFIPIALLLKFSNVEIVILLALYASPAAVTSFIVAKSYKADSELAGQIVAIGAVVSIITLFFTILLLRGIEAV